VKSTSWRGGAAIWSLSGQGARKPRTPSAEAVTERSKQRIIAAAEFWLASHPDDAQSFIRFDVILVTPGKLPRHIAMRSMPAVEPRKRRML